MKYTYPSVYASNLHPLLVKLAPSFEAVVKGYCVEAPPWMNTVTLTSRDGQEFTHYAKFTNFSKGELSNKLNTERSYWEQFLVVFRAIT